MAEEERTRRRFARNWRVRPADRVERAHRLPAGHPSSRLNVATMSAAARNASAVPRDYRLDAVEDYGWAWPAEPNRSIRSSTTFWTASMTGPMILTTAYWSGLALSCASSVVR